MHTARRYWMLRAYIAIRALVIVVNMLLDPSALTRKAVDTSGAIGWFAISALGALALIAIFDVIVNDLFPDRFTLPSFFRKRHLVYMGLALGLMSMSMVAYRGGSGSVIAFFWVDACFACAVAIADTFARHHQDQRQVDRRSHHNRRGTDRRSIA